MALGLNSFNMFTDYSNPFSGSWNLGSSNSFGFSNFLGGGLIGGLLGGNMGAGCTMFNNCDGTINYNAMAGFQVANTFTNIGVSALSQHIASKKANSTESKEAQIEALNKKIDDLKSKNSGYEKDIEDYMRDADLDSSSSDKEKVINDKYDEKQKAYDAAIKQRDDNKDAAKGYKTKAEAEAEADEVKKADAANAVKYFEALETIKTVKPEYDKIKTVKNKVCGSSGLLEKIKKNNEQIADYQKKINELQGDIEEQILDKADGHYYQQTGETRFKEKFTDNDDGTLTINTYKKTDKKTGVQVDVPYEVEKGDLRYLIQSYRNCTNDTERKKCAKQFHSLWEKTYGQDVRNDGSLRDAAKIIEDYYKKNC